MNKMVEDLRLTNPNATEGELQECVEYLESTFPNAIENYLNDENNYGLLFYIAGYNGVKQQEFQQEILDMFGVEVF